MPTPARDFGRTFRGIRAPHAGKRGRACNQRAAELSSISCDSAGVSGPVLPATSWSYTAYRPMWRPTVVGGIGKTRLAHRLNSEVQRDSPLQRSSERYQLKPLVLLFAEHGEA